MAPPGPGVPGKAGDRRIPLGDSLALFVRILRGGDPSQNISKTHAPNHGAGGLPRIRHLPASPAAERDGGFFGEVWQFDRGAGSKRTQNSRRPGGGSLSCSWGPRAVVLRPGFFPIQISQGGESPRRIRVRLSLS